MDMGRDDRTSRHFWRCSICEPVFDLTDARILSNADGGTAEQRYLGLVEDAAVQSED